MKLYLYMVAAVTVKPLRKVEEQVQDTEDFVKQKWSETMWRISD